MSSIMRRRSGEIFSGESFMVLLRLRYEAECLTSQHTKQNLRGQPIANLRSKPPLPRERFSPSTPICHSRPAASRQSDQLFCFASTSRASLSCVQFGAYLSASSYLVSASF